MSFRPLLVASGISSGGMTTFFLPKEEVEVHLPRGFIQSLAQLCDGTREIEAIVRSLGAKWDESESRAAIDELFQRGVLVDSRNISSHVWEFVKNPSPWNHPLSQDDIRALVLDQRHHEVTGRGRRYTVRDTPWTKHLLRRGSHRAFGSESVDEAALIRMLWSAYGKTNIVLDSQGSSQVYRRTVPSAGALYPLRIYLVAFRPSGTIKPGVYRITDSPKVVHLHKVKAHHEAIRSAFIQHDVLSTAHGAIIICGSFARSSSKYANRALAYTVLEAGHAAQNIVLSASHDRVATLEAGGFTENEITKALGLPADLNPIVTVVYGSPHTAGKKALPTATSALSRVVRELQTVPTTVGNFQLPYHMVFGKVISDAGAQTWWSCGRSPNLALAKTKATAEAVEWFASSRGNECEFVVGSLTDLGVRAIDPRLMHPYSPQQLRSTKFVVPFDPEGQYQWCPVEEISTGKQKLVLADFVYYPFVPSSKKRYAYANSSGAAAHRNEEQALERAVLELIERDAFMVTWLNRQHLPSITPQSMPDSVVARLRALQRLGFQTSVLDMTYDLTPVIFVGVMNGSMSYFTCSAASDFNPSRALDRALMEVEGSVYCRIRDGHTKQMIRPDEVWEVHDRDLLYQQPRSIRRTRFLMGETRNGTSLDHVVRRGSPRSMTELIAQLRQNGYPCLRANLSQDDELLRTLPFTVVKAFVPGLVPLVFEYGLDAIDLERARMLPVWCGYAQRPLPTARLNTYPHPYT